MLGVGLGHRVPALRSPPPTGVEGCSFCVPQFPIQCLWLQKKIKWLCRVTEKLWGRNKASTRWTVIPANSFRWTLPSPGLGRRQPEGWERTWKSTLEPHVSRMFISFLQLWVQVPSKVSTLTKTLRLISCKWQKPKSKFLKQNEKLYCLTRII